ncbi:MAG TPA: hypothetical protein VH592_01525 [Gemmataceae bacterium]
MHVPVSNAIDRGCEDALREVERRGYVVWRVRGCAAPSMPYAARWPAMPSPRDLTN